MSDRIIVVSSDGHAGLKIGDYKPYVDTKYHDFLDQAVAMQVEAMTKAEERFLIKEINDEWRAPVERELRGAWDYSIRQEVLAADGIAAEIIYPDGITEMNTPPFGAGLGLNPQDAVPELQWAGANAHNRWLAEFCANDPKRLIGVASIPLLFDIDQAIEAVRGCVAQGIKNVMIPTIWGTYPAYHHLRYDPFWQACEDLGVVINFHSGPAPMQEYFGEGFPMENCEHLMPGAMGGFVSEVTWWLYRPLTFMIWGGVFERYPNLRVSATEGGTFFLVETMLRLLDHNYTDIHYSQKLGDFKSHLSMKPSEYFARNVALGASCVPRSDLELRDKIGVDRYMWGSDYPHPEGTWPNTQAYYQETFSGFPEEDGRKILGLNAIDWYDLDRDYLQNVANEIGPVSTLFN
jgi:predicted TIM-barrel fold metal-dependent hydrolase